MSIHLLGDFPGDDCLLRNAATILSRTDDVTAEEVIGLLDSLPYQARIDFMLEFISKNVDKAMVLLRELFDCCFGQLEKEAELSGGDGSYDDFVLVGSGGMEGMRSPIRHRHHILRVVILVVPRCGSDEFLLEIYQAYKRVFSNVFHMELLKALARSTVSDEKLIEEYNEDVPKVQAAIVQTCISLRQHRAGFLDHLYKTGCISNADVQYLVPAGTSSLHDSIFAPKSTMRLKNWSVHDTLYYNLLRHLLQEYPYDPIGRGDAFRLFEKRIDDTSMSPENHLKILEITCELQPMELVPDTPDYVAKKLRELSINGDLGSAPLNRAELRDSMPSGFDKIRRKDQMSWLVSQIVENEQQQLQFKIPTRQDFILNFIANRRGPPTRAPDSFLELIIRSFKTNVSREIFWSTIEVTNHIPDGVPHKLFAAFRVYIFSIFGEKTIINQNREILLAFSVMYKRFAPSQGVENQKLWNKWISTFSSAYSYGIEGIYHKIQGAIQESSPTGERTRATLFVGYMHILLKQYTEGLRLAFDRKGIDVITLAEKVLKCFDMAHGIHSKYHEEPNLPAVRLYTWMNEYIAKNILPNLALVPTVTDISDKEQYGKKPRVLDVLATISKSKFKGELSLNAVKILLSVRHAASLDNRALKNGFVEVERCDQDGTSKIVFEKVDTEFHSSIVNTCNSIAKRMLYTLVKDSDDVYIPLVIAIWEMLCPSKEVRKEMEKTASEIAKLGKEMYKKSRKSEGLYWNHYLVRDYMDMITSCKKIVLERERATLIEMGKMLLEVEDFANVSSMYKQFSDLSTDIWGCIVGNDVKLSLELAEQHKDVRIPEVWLKMLSSTSGRDANLRILAHIDLLRASLRFGIEEYAKSIIFVSKRTKNEAGLYRRVLFDYLEGTIRDVICKVFETTHETKRIESTSHIMDALIRFLIDDVSKRDTIAKNNMSRISNIIIRCIMGMPKLTTAGIQLHSMWCNGAVTLDWIVKDSIKGESQLKKYVWPLTEERFSDFIGVIDPVMIESFVRPVMKSTCRLGNELANEVMRLVWSKQFVKDSIPSHRDKLTPSEQVDILNNAILAAHNYHRVGSTGDVTWLDDNVLGYFPRVLVLFRVIGVRWREALYLVQIFDEVMAKVDWNMPFSQQNADDAMSLFELLASLEYATWFYDPALVRACDCLFRYIVRWSSDSLSTPVDFLNRRWLPMRRSRPFGLERLNSHPLYCAFIFAKVGPQLQPLILDKNAYQSRNLELQMEITRDLLLLEGAIGSAIYLSSVSSDVLSNRDDLVMKYFDGSCLRGDDLMGPFNPRFEIVSPKGEDLEQDRKSVIQPYRLIPHSKLVKMQSRVILHYHKFCEGEATDRYKGIATRSNRVAEIMASPVTSHEDVIRLFTTFREEGPILETLLLGVFQLESVTLWRVLSYILSPAVIEANPQRTTAGLLENLTKVIHESKVTEVFSVLLSDHRRHVLSMFLCKRIISSLFGTSSTNARDILEREWRRSDVSDDLRHEFCRLAILHITTVNISSPQEEGTVDHMTSFSWMILKEAATVSNLELDTCVLFLAPHWSGFEIKGVTYSALKGSLHKTSQIPRHQFSYNIERDVLKAFQYKFEMARSAAASMLSLGDFENIAGWCDAWQEVLTALSTNHNNELIRMVAKSNSHQFNHAALCGKAASDFYDALVHDLEDLVFEESISYDFQLSSQVNLFVGFALLELQLEYDSHHKADQTKELYKTIVNTSDVAKKLTTLLGTVLDKTTTARVDEFSINRHSVNVFSEILNAINLWDPVWKNEIIDVPLKEQLDLLRNAVALLRRI
eukprot:scaffold72307_cov51-Attheya_sp.AAC.1